MKFDTLVLFLYLILCPFYFFKSGLPQVADFILIIGIIKSLGKPINSIKLNGIMRPLKYLVVYVFIVNLFWVFMIDWNLHKKPHTLVFFSFYFLYNLGAYGFIIYLYAKHGKRIFTLVAYGVALSLALQVVLHILTGDSRFRAEMFFNNPNQAGYYALSMMILFALSLKRLDIGNLFKIVALLLSSYVIIVTTSKAAMVSSVLIIPLVLFSGKKINAVKIFGVLILLAIASYFVLNSDFFLLANDNIANRFSEVGGDDTLAGRGYDRIFKYPQHLFFGAGEGGNYRWDVEMQGEIHSSFGTILFSYGIFGFACFISFLFKHARFVGFNIFLYTLPLHLYGITHQGLRFTQFWLILGLAIIIKVQEYAKKKANQGNNRSSFSKIPFKRAA